MLPILEPASRALRPVLLICAFVPFGGELRAQAGANDPTFNVLDDGTYGDGIDANGTVLVVAVQPDGKSVIGGNFASYHGVERRGLARLNADGSLDASFVPSTDTRDVLALALQPDGKLLVGGLFAVGTRPLMRLNADGSTDATFQTGLGNEDWVNALALQPDGKVLVAGEFTNWSGVARGRIARLNPDGSLDATYAPPIGADAGILSIALQPDGRLLVAGGFHAYDGVARNGLARLNVDGSLDASFDPGLGANTGFNHVVLQPDGKVVVAGGFTSVHGVPRSGLARLNPDGALDPSFDPGPGANDWIAALARQADGQLLIGGNFTGFGGIARRRIARLNQDGSLDPSFATATGVDGEVRFIALQADGKALFSGEFTSFDGVLRQGIARTNLDGSRDATFNPGRGANGVVNDVALQADGKALVCGDFTAFNDVPRTRVARLGADGALDATFATGAGADGPVRTVRVQPDGRVLIAGAFTSYAGVARARIARLNRDGSLDAVFVPGVITAQSSEASPVALQTNGRVLIGGAFALPGPAIARVARLNADGSLDATFAAGTGVNDHVLAIVVQPDGKVLVAGRFTTYHGAQCSRLVRLNADGSRDPSFVTASGANSVIRALALQPDGRVLIAGDFTGFSGVLRLRVARLLTDGSLDASFAPDDGANLTVRSLALQPDERVLIAGEFTHVDLVARNGVARLLTDGTLDASFDPGAGANGAVQAIVLQPDGRALLAGSFTRYGDASRHRVARVFAAPSYPASCSGDGGGTACPCGNNGASGNGCANSLNPAGAHLGASGFASLAGDTLMLAGSGMPDNSALYFQGTTPSNGGLGSAFGDGLRCAGGVVTRLGTRSNSGGASSYPGAGDPPVSVRGGVAIPGSRTYQVWYRNAASYCTVSTFNLTNGLSVTWQP